MCELNICDVPFLSLQKDISMEKMSVGTQPDSLDLSLESLNKLNGSLGLRREGCQADGGKSGGDGCKLEEPSSSSFSSRPGGDPVGSLSDSLYDSFSSCTSQGSNEV